MCCVAFVCVNVLLFIIVFARVLFLLFVIVCSVLYGGVDAWCMCL